MKNRPARQRQDQQIESLGRDSRGQVVPMLAVSFALLLAFVGLVIDGGRIYLEKRRVQQAADAGAIGAAFELWRRNTDLGTQVRPAAINDTSLHGYDDGNSTITVNKAVDNLSVEVIVEQDVPSTLMRILNVNQSTVKARAKAALVPYIDVCILALDPDDPEALIVRGTADLTADCGIMSNSYAGDGFQTDGTLALRSNWMGVSGGYQNNGGGTVDPNPDETVPPFIDPLGFLQPPNYAGWPAGFYDAATLTYRCPGGQCVWNTMIDVAGPPGNKTFESGIHVLRDGLTIQSTNVITGSEIMFYNTGEGAGIRIAGQADVTFTAPTSGPYKGILFYTDRSAPNLTNEFGRGDAVISFRGALYFPSQDLSIEGSFAGASPWGIIIANTIDYAGEAAFTLSRPPASEAPDIRKVTLVE